MAKLFAYGTLKDCNADDTHFVLGRLYSLGSFPGVKFCDCKPTKVPGQVIEVTNEQLLDFDRYEGVPHLYKRVKAVAQRFDGQPFEIVWVYEWVGAVDEKSEIQKWPT